MCGHGSRQLQEPSTVRDPASSVRRCREASTKSQGCSPVLSVAELLIGLLCPLFPQPLLQFPSDLAPFTAPQLCHRALGWPASGWPVTAATSCFLFSLSCRTFSCSACCHHLLTSHIWTTLLTFRRSCPALSPTSPAQCQVAPWNDHRPPNTPLHVQEA